MASDKEIDAADKALRFYGTTLNKERIAAALEAAENAREEELEKIIKEAKDWARKK